MEMKQFETLGQPLGFEHFSRHQQLGGAETELGVFAGALGPSATAFAQEARPKTDDRLDPKLLRDGDDLPQFLQLFDHHDHSLPKFYAEQRDAHKIRSLITVTNNQAAKQAL